MRHIDAKSLTIYKYNDTIFQDNKNWCPRCVYMEESMQKELMAKMVENLPTLRRKLNISQADLGKMIGVSRTTIYTIETKKRPLTWNTFLSLILVFTKNAETDKMLTIFEIYTDELNNLLKIRSSSEELK